MIGKVPKPGKGFKGLVAYLLDGDKRSPTHDRDRVAWTQTRNLLIDDPRKVPALMRATAAHSKRVKKPVYHYVISWHRDEAPSDEQMLLVADTTCADLGLDEHQLLFIAHKDTAHRHVHIVANRIHPETGIAWKTSHDYRRIEQSLRRQSEAMGFEPVPGLHSDARYAKTTLRQSLKDPAFQKARREKRPTAAPPRLEDHRRNAFLLACETAGDWQDLHTSLAAFGFRLARKGQGLVVFDGDHERKFSAIDKSIRLKRFEDQFGEAYQPASDADLDQKLSDPAQRRLTLTAVLRRRGALPAAVEQHLERAVAPRKAEQTPSTDKAPERQLLYRDYLDAEAATDFAFALHGMGLESDGALRRALYRRNELRARLDESKTTMQQLTKDVGKDLSQSKKLRSTHQPTPDHEPASPSPTRRELKRGRKKRLSLR